MGRKLSAFVRGSLRIMTRQHDYYGCNPAERQHRRALLRALLALSPESVAALELGEFPATEDMKSAARRVGVPVEVVREACGNFMCFFRGGLVPRLRAEQPG